MTPREECKPFRNLSRTWRNPALLCSALPCPPTWHSTKWTPLLRCSSDPNLSFPPNFTRCYSELSTTGSLARSLPRIVSSHCIRSLLLHKEGLLGVMAGGLSASGTDPRVSVSVAAAAEESKNGQKQEPQTMPSRIRIQVLVERLWQGIRWSGWAREFEISVISECCGASISNGNRFRFGRFWSWYKSSSGEMSSGLSEARDSFVLSVQNSVVTSCSFIVLALSISQQVHALTEERNEQGEAIQDSTGVANQTESC